MNYDLKPTQVEVLKVLALNPEKRMGVSDIKKLCNVNSANISNALRFFANHDLVYQPDMQGKVMISPDGEDAISRYM
jgi:predicted transcriptional regulator